MHAALLLAREGAFVELFEKEPLAGGMLRYYLPKFRFTRNGIGEKTRQLEQLGVKMHLNTEIGKSLPLQALVEKFNAVVLAPGEWKARKLNANGEGLEGVCYWTSFLRDYNEGKAEALKGKKAVVIGGGDTAVDCARTAKHLGAEATIVYRRSREEMPAIKGDIMKAEGEGVKLLFNLAPVQFAGNNRLEKVLFEKTITRAGKLEKTGEKTGIAADTAIIAIGQEPDLGILEGSPYKSLSQLPKKVVLAGDIANEQKLIARAVQSAEKAVEKIKKLYRQ
jgi:formate dehydrogenase major subunit